MSTSTGGGSSFPTDSDMDTEGRPLINAPPPPRRGGPTAGWVLEHGFPGDDLPVLTPACSEMDLPCLGGETYALTLVNSARNTGTSIAVVVYDGWLDGTLAPVLGAEPGGESGCCNSSLASRVLIWELPADDVVAAMTPSDSSRAKSALNSSTARLNPAKDPMRTPLMADSPMVLSSEEALAAGRAVLRAQFSSPPLALCCAPRGAWCCHRRVGGAWGGHAWRVQWDAGCLSSAPSLYVDGENVLTGKELGMPPGPCLVAGLCLKASIGCVICCPCQGGYDGLLDMLTCRLFRSCSPCCAGGAGFDVDDRRLTKGLPLIGSAPQGQSMNDGPPVPRSPNAMSALKTESASDRGPGAAIVATEWRRGTLSLRKGAQALATVSGTAMKK